MTTTPAGPSILDPELVADPYGGFNQLREQAPVVRGRTAEGAPAWYVSRHDEVRAVLGDPRFVNNPASVPGLNVNENRERMLVMLDIPAELLPYITESVLDLDGVHHARLRRLVSRAFTGKRVQAMRPRVAAIAAGLLDGLDDTPDLIPEFAYPLPITVICELVGVPERDRELWRSAGSALTSITPESKGEAARELVAYTHRLVRSRRAEPADDLVTELLGARDESGDRLSEVELVTMILSLATAGHETTAHLIGNGVQALLTHPEQLSLLREDPSRWTSAVQELVRWSASILITQLRYAAADVVVGGQLIRRGEAVQTILVSANRDPRVFDDPERFDVTRPQKNNIGFGVGPHHCLGALLARQECEVALRSLFNRFPDVALVGDPRWASVPGMRQLVTLPVTLRGRSTLLSDRGKDNLER
ncbi:cytochrome P450 family protein [Saccharopolyspora phatthalungensis]|uniref:Cytochrome P450 n=1 Tax=Saccharopolyspora phatthalungensis TaxID=664693 RepID=A0A840QEY1_9PSEU|nr:cytochrome P450 [Saccharopolyspora phatthalungensis]MBB5155613.1 hypothetical protein [Saccharopolyspora phatthalungensis]